MGLEMQSGRSQWWYGRVRVNKKAYTRNLGVKIEGRVPPTLEEMGDALFERSRAKAQAVFEKWRDELQRKSSAEELIQAVHESRAAASTLGTARATSTNCFAPRATQARTS